MKHIKPFNLSEELIPGGKAFGLELEDIAQEHQVPLEGLKKALIVGIKVEGEHTPDRAKAREIAMDHLAEDPDYYTKLIQAGIVDEPEALRAYELLYGQTVTNEGYYDPPEYPDPPDPVVGIEYSRAEQLFTYLSGDKTEFVLLKKKSDGSYWILNVVDMEGDDEFEDYYYIINWDESESEIDEDLLDETFVNVATDLFKKNKWVEGTLENWEAGESRLFKLTEEIAEDLFSIYSSFIRRTSKVYPWKRTGGGRSQGGGSDIKDFLGDLARIYPDAED
jgi:hypothetical protein